MKHQSIAKELLLDIVGITILLILLLNLDNTDTWIALASTGIFAAAALTRTAVRARQLAKQRRQP